MFVISSGAKSILDLEKTFEKLETFLEYLELHITQISCQDFGMKKLTLK